MEAYLNMEQKKLNIGFVSNSPLIRTGLGRNMKAIVPALYKTDKYNIFFLNQSMGNDDPNYQKFPWKNFGAMAGLDQNRLNQDQNYARICAYGNLSVENFVLSNKIDCLVLSDDQWGYLNEFYLDKDWFKHMATNILPIITADSEPLLPQIKQWAEKCSNMKFWSSFAEKKLKEENYEKYKHCGVIYGALNINEFKPIPKQERLGLRHKFNIKDDEKIIIYLGRNQLRKIFGSNIEGLAKFKKKNPDKKVRLLFHCSWSEPGGWPLNQIREQYGLNKEDILTSYFCRNCQDWEIKCYDGEDLDCPHCKAQKSRITAGITSSINEEDLNKIYNIADGSCSVFTSGAFEFTNPESMLVGLPLAVPNYVCGEDFINSGVVKEIKGTLTFEHNTGFRKFVADSDSICEFFEYVYSLTDKEREDLSNKSRQWAISQFDTNLVVKKYEEFFDSCKPIDWDVYFNRKKELKNINAQVEDKQTDVEFIDHCYKAILNMDLAESDDGKQHWAKFLAQPGDKRKLRESLVNSFRAAAVEHNKKVQPQIPFESLLINNGKKQFLIVCPESAGDCLYVSATLKSFRESYPSDQWNLYLATKPEFMELFDLCPYLDKLLPYQDWMQSEIHCLGQGDRKGIFQGYSFVTAQSQKFLNYLGNHNINLQLT